MKVIATSSLKGGAGKTTLTLHLATATEHAGIRTAVVDLDPQQAAAKWSDGREATRPPVTSAMATRLPRVLSELERDGTALVFLDTAAHAEAILTPALDAADFVLIPCRPTAIDIQHLAVTGQLVASRGKPAAVVLNAVNERVAEYEQARRAVANMGLTVAPVSISNLVGYSRALTAGQGVTEFEPAGKAAQEILSLLQWISGILYLSDSRLFDKSKETPNRSRHP